MRILNSGIDVHAELSAVVQIAHATAAAAADDDSSLAFIERCHHRHAHCLAFMYTLSTSFSSSSVASLFSPVSSATSAGRAS